MSLSTVRTEIKTIIEAVTGIGKVYEYERLTHDFKQYNKLFTKNDKVNVWQIERPTFKFYVHGSAGSTSGVERKIHDFVIHGWYGLSDDLASEKTFQDLVELVCQAFRNKPDLNATAEMIKMSPDNPITGDIGKDYLGEVLCHTVRINISIQERTAF